MGTASGSPPVVEGKGFKFTRDQYELLLKTMKPEQRRILTNDRLTRVRFLYHIAQVESLAAEAEKNGFDRKPEVAFRLNFLRKEELARLWVENEVRRKMRFFKLSDKDLRLYYETHKSEFKDPSGKVEPFSKVRDLIYEKLKDRYRRNLIADIVQKTLSKYKVKILPQNLR